MTGRKTAALVRSDLLTNRAAAALLAAGYGLLLVCVLAKPGFLTAEVVDEERFKSNFFIFADFLLPTLFSLFVLAVFNRDCAKPTYEYVLTLPMRPVGWFATRFFLYAAASSALFFGFLAAAAKPLAALLPAGFPLWRVLLPSFANLLFLLSFAFLAALALKNDFAATLCFFGPLFLDFFTQAEVFETHSLFVASFRTYLPAAVYRQNRATVFALAGLCLLLALALLCRPRRPRRAMGNAGK